MSSFQTNNDEVPQSLKTATAKDAFSDCFWIRDAVIVVCASIFMTFVGGYFDLFERCHAFVHHHENWPLDEVTIGIFSLAMLLIWFSWRRLRQANLLKSIALKLREEAFEASQAKTYFLANMSHELRTPLNSIIGYADALSLGVFGKLGNAKQAEYLSDVVASGHHLLNLINDILDISKIEAAKQDLNEEVIKVPALMDVSVRQVKILAETKNIILSFDTPTDSPSLFCDERRAVQVFVNILSNAIKFTSEGGRVSFVAELRADNGYVFVISDTGSGIAPEDISKVIQPFKQTGDVLTKSKEEGTGLGLALCTSLMDLFSGNLTIDSQLGLGTTVTVHFPPERTIHPS